jgi:hypothetical protein
MKLASLSAAISDYRNITGEKVENYRYTDYINGNFYDIERNKYLRILPSNEWLIWAVGERYGFRYLWLDQSYGFINHFVPYLLEVMRFNNLEWICTATTRNPKAHIRKWKMERLPEHDYMFEGRFYFVLKGHRSNLK